MPLVRTRRAAKTARLSGPALVKGLAKTSVVKTTDGLMSIFNLAGTIAKTGTLTNTLNVCHKLSLIVLSLYGTAWLSQLNATVAPLQKIVDLFELALAPKAYPTSPMVLPDLEEFSSTPSDWDVSPKGSSK